MTEKLWVVSDLHGKCFLGPPTDATIAVLAGDIENEEYVLEIAKMIPTVWVAGNHDFYGKNIYEELRRLKKLKDVHFLDRETAFINGIRFIGGTLWTDYCLYGRAHQEQCMRSAQAYMSDHRQILDSTGKFFKPSQALQQWTGTRNYIHGELLENYDGPTVVVTHHCPHPKSIHPKYGVDALNAAFSSDMSDLMRLGEPVLWIHGHTHTNFNYIVGKTRIVCNPKGYKDENPDFNPNLILEVRT